MKVTIIKSNIYTVLEQIKDEDIVHFTAMKCEIDKIPPLPFKNLKILDLSYNKIEKCQNIPDSIQYLNLSHNNLERLEDIQFPSELRYLNLSHNPILKSACYRGKMIGHLKQVSPNILFLDNVPIKTKYLEKAFNLDEFEEFMGYAYHLIQEE